MANRPRHTCEGVTVDQPIYWGVLAIMATVGAAARLAARGPLWQRRARAIPSGELVVAAIAVALLVFHCGAMFFMDWVDAVPFAEAPATAVRDLDSAASRVAYWAPAATLVIALRRLWPPALLFLVVALIGVGYTMFVPHALTTHLAWLASAVVAVVLIATALVFIRRPRGRSRMGRAVAGTT